MILPARIRQKRKFKMILLKTSTVDELKRLLQEMGKARLDELILELIRVTRSHRQALSEKIRDPEISPEQKCLW